MTWVQNYVIPIITSLGGVAGLVALLEGLARRKRSKVDLSKVLVDSAISMTERLQKEVDALDKQLAATRATASDLSEKLKEANTRAGELKTRHDNISEQLGDAQAEIRVLRLQVKNLSAELDKHTGTDPWKSK